MTRRWSDSRLHTPQQQQTAVTRTLLSSLLIDVQLHVFLVNRISSTISIRLSAGYTKESKSKHELFACFITIHVVAN